MEELLDKYVDITIKIRDIQKSIFDYKKDIETKLAKASSREKKDKILNKFKKTTENIRNSNKNYKLLIEKQKDIKNKIVKNSILDINTNNSLSYLKDKYERLSNNKIKIIDNDNTRNEINNILSNL